MKRVVVRVSDTYSMDSAAAAILKLYGYLTFVESFRSFSIITFDCPEKYSSGLLDKLNALGPVKQCTWDADDKFSTAPDEGATLTVETDDTLAVNTSGETSATRNTRNLTTSGSGTIYVKVQILVDKTYTYMAVVLVDHFLYMQTNLDLLKVVHIHLINQIPQTLHTH